MTLAVLVRLHARNGVLARFYLLQIVRVVLDQVVRVVDQTMKVGKVYGLGIFQCSGHE